MQGTVHVASTAFDRDMELHADAVVEPGPGQGDATAEGRRDRSRAAEQ